ncbi:carbohydrate ABC transporter permease [Nocardiopsis lambiniae]|uniref:Sugar ABC transporter permease n=1 Tax=Nocardiopsis lambiniae TaxID=3075539 RepID=A0ABU2M5H9_9ACTN|nr:sugar ABC transporter permease [Nocardiopsis sp. DSM 44743]MDT0327852.1 sugar ABC transporter permease [Nocardiopsis sp. DSM 44743]
MTTTETAAAPPSPGTRSPRRTQGGEAALAWAFLTPSIVVFALFLAYPLGRTVYLSMHGNDIIGRPNRFVGFSHFAEMASPEFVKVLTTTLLFTIGTVVPGVVGALAIVLLLEGVIRGQRFLRGAFALPFAFSVASASVIFVVFYSPGNSVLNGILYRLGLDQVPWLTSQDMALWSVCITTVWMNLGYGVLVLAAGIGSIPKEINEAARIDGATGVRLARDVTVPMLGPQLFFLIVISTINALQSFGQIHILTRGGPSGSTTTLVYSIFEDAFAYSTSDFGRASAQALVLLLVVLVCTAVQFGVIERKVHYA